MHTATVQRDRCVSAHPRDSCSRAAANEGSNSSQSSAHVLEQAWQPVVDAVHEAGGYFYLQLWHCGRASHPTYQPEGQVPTHACQTYKESEVAEIRDRDSHARAGRLRCLLPPYPLAPTGRCACLRLVACLLFMPFSTRGTLSASTASCNCLSTAWM